MSFLHEDRPELAGSLAQMALCSKPSTNDLIERREGKGRVSVFYKHRNKELGNSITNTSLLTLLGECQVKNAPARLDHPDDWSGQKEVNTCDLVMISSTANCWDVEEHAAVLNIHCTIPCIYRSMEMYASICIQTTVVHEASATLQNKQILQSSPGSVRMQSKMMLDVLHTYICSDMPQCFFFFFLYIQNFKLKYKQLVVQICDG